MGWGIFWCGVCFEWWGGCKWVWGDGGGDLIYFSGGVGIFFGLWGFFECVWG